MIIKKKYGVFGIICLTLFITLNIRLYGYVFSNMYLHLNSTSVLLGRLKNPFYVQLISNQTLSPKANFTMTVVKNSNKSLNSSTKIINGNQFLNLSLNSSKNKEENRKNDTSDSEKKSTEDFRKSHFMTVPPQGRLGNQMFQFASLLGIAAMHGYTPFINSNHKMHQIFNLRERKDIVLTNSKDHHDGSAGKYDVRVEGLSHKYNWTIRGYLQSWKYFRYINDDARKSFRFKEPFLKYAKRLLLKVNPNNRTTVGVHIRRGDMNTNYERKRGYISAPLDFINKAIKYFRNNLTDPIFIVVSDDRGWAKQNLKDGDIFHSPFGSPGNDMAVLANCNHGIISSGTFGWFGAWLTGGQVVYYKNFPANGSWLATLYNKSEYYLPNWIGME